MHCKCDFLEVLSVKILPPFKPGLASQNGLRFLDPWCEPFDLSLRSEIRITVPNWEVFGLWCWFASCVGGEPRRRTAFYPSTIDEIWMESSRGRQCSIKTPISTPFKWLQVCNHKQGCCKIGFLMDIESTVALHSAKRRDFHSKEGWNVFQLNMRWEFE